ncbi:MAG: hypothetical protein QOG01_434, partial [Pseudonocardiales bacterium]|nr:hypothetical protein [Pseudonocardiales bacterium]
FARVGLPHPNRREAEYWVQLGRGRDGFVGGVRFDFPVGGGDGYGCDVAPNCGHGVQPSMEMCASPVLIDSVRLS